MTGKSSGIVRCHYGVSSLAAMAAVGLEVFEKPQQFWAITAPTSGSVRPATSSASANPTSTRCAKALPRNAPSGCRPRRSTRRGRRMWPFADLTPFAAFGWEARGGYGDAYQTAQAFAASARAAGVRVRQGATVTGLLVDGDRVTGVRLADGTEISAGTVVVATGVWTRPFLEPYGVDVPIRVVREQIVHDRPRRATRRAAAGVLRPGVAAVRAPRGRRRHPVRQQRPRRDCRRRPTPTTTSTAPPRRSSTSPSTRSAPASPASPTRRSPAATPAATTSPRTGTR